MGGFLIKPDIESNFTKNERYLVNEFNDRQIIIFTCSHREKDILTQENIHYNFVTI